MTAHTPIVAAPVGLLDDYTKATFPYDVSWKQGGKVRLLAAFQNKVVGVSYGSFERDGETVEYLNQVLDWDGQGVFGAGQYPEMDLPPPPARQTEVVAALEGEAAAIRARLDANPEAPAEWRERDERTVASIERKIANLVGGGA